MSSKQILSFFKRGDHRSHGMILLAVPLILSAFTHFWNITGVPYGTSYDEGIYIRRSLHVLAGQGPQESLLYDHPYFSQLFMAGILNIVGYPNSLNTSSIDRPSMEVLYAIPRAITGVLAIIDTLLLYKISEYRYNSRTIAIIASTLFAVMPLSWDTRRVLLENIQLPFLLCSILLAIRCKNNPSDKDKKKTLSVLISGIFFGLSIFTKVPIFTLLPLVAFLIFRYNNRSLKALGLWFIPVTLVPLIWPGFAVYIDQPHLWLHGIYFQTHRGADLLFESIKYKIVYDVVLVSLGLIGLVYGAIRRDALVILGTIPFLIFLYFVGYVSLWHLIPLLPIVCILSSRLLEDGLNIVNRTGKNKFVKKLLPSIIILGICILSLTTIVTLLLVSDNSFHFEAAGFLSQYLTTANTTYGDTSQKNRIILIANPFYSWIPKYVYHLDNYYIVDYYDDIPIKAEKVVFVTDLQWKLKSALHNLGEKMETNFNLYGKDRIATFGDGYNQVSVYEYASRPDSNETKKASLRPRLSDDGSNNEFLRLYNITSPSQ